MKTAVSRLSSILALATVMLGTASTARSQALHVDASATGTNDGSDWANAYSSLQDALAGALAGDELWVAAGTYRPDQGVAQTPGDRSATFQLLDGVEIYGGFDGTELFLGDRAGLFSSTILSGDLAGDDLPGLGNIAENSHHVVTASGTDSSARLDGFAIVSGNADAGGSPGDDGGGCLNVGGSPLLADCFFSANNALNNGGGMINAGGAAQLKRCDFRDNLAQVFGGGVHNSVGSQTQLEDCLFEDNVSLAGGGGMCSNFAVTTRLTRCRFVSNTAPSGGGLCVLNSGATLVNCGFFGNVGQTTTGTGGGMSVEAPNSTTILSGCVFSGNTHINRSGGLMVRGTNTACQVLNCSFTANHANLVGGALVVETGASLQLSNSVSWGNTSGNGSLEQAQVGLGIGNGMTLTVDSCCIEGLSGGLGGLGNIGSDPFLVDADGADNVVGTVDDDLHLGTGALCIDAAAAAFLPSDITDLDCDGDTAEALPLDADGLNRLFDDPATVDTGSGALSYLDMGAYEFGSTAPTTSWLDLGNALAGSHGLPLLSSTAQGPFCPGTVFNLLLGNALENTTAHLVLGLTNLSLPLKGGLIVPSPDIVLPLPTGPAGTLSVPLLVPDFPALSGLTIFWQYWIQDGAAVVGFSASNALSSTLP